MNILITGVRGQLGAELLTILKAGNSEIGEIPRCYIGAKIIGVDIEDVDISCYNQVEAAIDKVQPNIIFNCAAMTNVDGCESDYAAAGKGNSMGPRNLAVAAEKFGAKLVHISTDYVFPGNSSTPYCEWDACSPSTIYGKSKLLGEKYVAEFSSRYFIVRTAWLYGKTGKNFVKTMLRLGQEKDQISVVNDQVGNPTNANDLGHHLLQLAATEAYGVYHCSGTGQCSWCEFASAIMAEAGLSCEVRPCTSAEYPSPTPRPKFSALANMMLALEVGDEMRPWQEALHSYIAGLKKGENI